MVSASTSSSRKVEVNSTYRTQHRRPHSGAGTGRMLLRSCCQVSESVVKLSILMPVYNEETRLPEALKQALTVDYPCEVELVVVDDGSGDATPEILSRVDDARVTVVTQPRNQGKGAAIKSGVDRAAGDCLVILDADLEYDPQDIPRLLEPVL